MNKKRRSSVLLFLFFGISVLLSNAYSMKIEAESYTSKDAVSQSYGTVMGSLNSGCWLKYAGVQLNNESFFQARLSSSGGDGIIEVRTGSITGTLIASLAVASTGGWDTYNVQATEVSPSNGTYDVFLVFKNNEYGVCNLDWFEFGNFPPILSLQTQYTVLLPINSITISASPLMTSTITKRTWELISGTATISAQNDVAQISDLLAGNTVIRYTAFNKNGSTSVDITITAVEGFVSKALSTDPSRVKIITTTLGSTVATADGERLRGIPIGYQTGDLNDPTKLIDDPSYYKKLRAKGFNVIKVFCENPDLYDTIKINNSLSICDTIVNLASRYGLQVVLNAGNISYYQDPAASELNRRIAYNLMFNQILTNRYKNRTHVIFEQQNEPYYNSSAKYPKVIDDIAVCYTEMRKIAPESHITLFAFMVPFDFSMVDLVKNLETKATIDWTITSVAYHGYGTSNNINNILALENNYPVICTEFWPDNYSIKPEGGYGASYEYQATGLESSEISWIAWILSNGNSDLSIYDPSFAELNQKGLMWNYTKTNLQEPVVNLGKDTTLLLPANSLSINADVSDLNGSIVKTKWEVVKNSAACNFSTNNNTATISNLLPGTYVVRLTAWDNEGYYTYDDIWIYVAKLHQLPGQIPAWEYSAANNVGGGNGASVGWISYTSWMEYKVNVAETALYSIAVSAGGIGSGYFIVDGVSNSSSFIIPTNTGGNTNFQDFPCSLYLTQGTHTIRFVPLVTGYNLDQMTFTKTSASLILPADQRFEYSPNPLELSITAEDASGIKSYSWQLVSGPNGFVLNPSTTNDLTIDNLIIGDYILKVIVITNNNVVVSGDIRVSVIPCIDNPTIWAGNDKKLTLPANTISLSPRTTSGSGIASYLWEKISGPENYTMDNPNADTLRLSNLQAGKYTFRVIIVSNKGCYASDVVNVTVSQATAIEDKDAYKMLKMYPNPADNWLTIDLSGLNISDASINLLNITGKIVGSWQINSEITTLPLNSYAKGLYLIKIKSQTSDTYKKLIIN
jgi:hypothetical protein